MIIAVIGLLIFFMLKIAFALCHFIVKLASPLPTWPVRGKFFCKLETFLDAVVIAIVPYWK
jgi:hypothetical protein